MHLILPKISIILRGRADRNNRKLLYIRYAVGGDTHWLSLKISIPESNWDAKKRMVKGRTDGPVINQHLNKVKFEAEQIAFEWATQNRGQILTFENFKRLYLKQDGTSSNTPLITDMLKVLKDIFIEKEISLASYRAYVVAVNAFIKVNLVQTLPELTVQIVAAFRKTIALKGNANLAAQYVRNLRVAFRHTVRRLELKVTDPFTEKVTITRLSSKKTISSKEYEQISRYFKQITGFDRDILRRFLVLCKGLRYSDTLHLQSSELQQFSDNEGNVLKYFNRRAQKSGIAGIIHFYDEDDLLEFRNDGKLFEPMTTADYNFHLKRLSKRIIGREITSHYGRHYAGDIAINSGFDIDDVKAILGISKESTARIYAKRQNTQILKKLLTYEKDKKNPSDG